RAGTALQADLARVDTEAGLAGQPGIAHATIGARAALGADRAAAIAVGRGALGPAALGRILAVARLAAAVGAQTSRRCGDAAREQRADHHEREGQQAQA